MKKCRQGVVIVINWQTCPFSLDRKTRCLLCLTFRVITFFLNYFTREGRRLFNLTRWTLCLLDCLLGLDEWTLLVFHVSPIATERICGAQFGCVIYARFLIPKWGQTATQSCIFLFWLGCSTHNHSSQFWHDFYTLVMIPNKDEEVVQYFHGFHRQFLCWYCMTIGPENHTLGFWSVSWTSLLLDVALQTSLSDVLVKL